MGSPRWTTRPSTRTSRSAACTGGAAKSIARSSVHQHIVARTNLDERHRDAALTELARDYFRAGLYDRAEELFQKLAAGGREPARGARLPGPHLRDPARLAAGRRDARAPARRRRARAAGRDRALLLRACGGCDCGARSAGRARASAQRPPRAARVRPQRDPARRPRAAAGRYRRSRCGCTAASCSATFTCCRSCCRGSPRSLGRRAIDSVLDCRDRRADPPRRGEPCGDRLCGDPERALRRSAPIVDCVREWLQIDSDLQAT